ncbi:hypothetical protein LTS15_008994 [Exophiala xenobiotica]|nr:hypothetical protein LTS15_008994 [Exophiala xenobiotica]
MAQLRTRIRQTEGFITDLEQARPLREVARSCGLSSNIVTHRIAVYNKRMTEIAFVMLNSDAGAGAGVLNPIRRTFTQTQAHDVFVDALVKNMMGLSMKEALREAAQEEIERVDTEEDSLFRMFGIWPARVHRIEIDGQLCSTSSFWIITALESFDTLLVDPSEYPVEPTKPAFLKRLNSETFKSVAAYSEFCNAGSTMRLTHLEEPEPSTLFLLKTFDQLLDTIEYRHHSGAKVKKKCLDYAEKHREPLYILNPMSYARLCNAGKMTGEVAHTVLRYLLNHMQIRFTMASKIDVGGGRTIIAGASVAPYEIVTVELN